MLIATIEDQLISVIKTHFNGVLKSVESLPSDFDAAEFNRVLRSAPGVFVVFSGGSSIESAQNAQIRGQWTVVALTDNAGGELARRRGSQVQIGAYEIIERLVALLHDYSLPDVGTLKLQSVENLYNGALDNKGVAMYAAVFGLPMTFENSVTDLSSLDDFVRFDNDINFVVADTQNESHDTVILEQ